MATDPHATLVERLKVLGHPDRLMLIELMQQAERFPDNLVDVRTVGVCVNDLAHEAGLPQSTTSTHLATLARAGLLHVTRHGQWRYARPDADAFDEVARHLRSIASP